jgi:hypothetical protein
MGLMQIREKSFGHLMEDSTVLQTFSPKSLMVMALSKPTRELLMHRVSSFIPLLDPRRLPEVQ